MRERINNFLLRFSRQQKILFVMAISLIITLVAQTWYSNYKMKKRVSETKNTTLNETRTLSPTTAEPGLTIISINPADEAQNVSLNEKIVVSFNRKLKTTEVTFTLLPSVAVTEDISERTLIVTPISPYQPGMRYTFVIRFPNSDQLPKTYSFTTIGPTQAFLSDTQPTGAFEKEESFQRENHPDVFLSNQTPFENDMFSIESEFKRIPTGHFSFRVLLKGDYEAAKQAAYNWIKSQGLTDTQIQKLEIEYTNY